VFDAVSVNAIVQFLMLLVGQ